VDLIVELLMVVLPVIQNRRALSELNRTHLDFTMAGAM
jgi:hypothetical protein